MCLRQPNGTPAISLTLCHRTRESLQRGSCDSCRQAAASQYEQHMPCVTLRGRCGQFMAFRTGHVSSPELHATVLSSAPRSRKTNEAYTDKCLIAGMFITNDDALSSMSHASTTYADATRRALHALAALGPPVQPPQQQRAVGRPIRLGQPNGLKACTGLTPRHQAHHPAWPFIPPTPRPPLTSGGTVLQRRQGLPYYTL